MRNQFLQRDIKARVEVDVGRRNFKSTEYCFYDKEA